MDISREFLIERKKNVFDYILMGLLCLGAIFATIALAGFLILQLYGMFAALAIFGIWFLVYYFISSRHIEYEYCVSAGEMDVDTVIGKKRRKHIVTVNIKDADIIAPATVEYHNQYEKEGITEKINATSGEGSALDFFIIFNDEKGNLARLVFTPNKDIIEAIKMYNPRNTFLPEE
ncbi:MAG: hypothetical protein IJC89_03820 [Clostridia bacterium]|nr:hypothetical protein [Clostridia bacterium]